MNPSRHTYSDAMLAVAPHIAELPQGGALLRELASLDRERDQSDPGFDVAEAVFYVGMLWHGGQFSPLYRAMCATGFAPGVSWRRPERGSVAAIMSAAMVRMLRSGAA